MFQNWPDTPPYGCSEPKQTNLEMHVNNVHIFKTCDITIDAPTETKGRGKQFKKKGGMKVEKILTNASSADTRSLLM
jgi:ribose 5-phosphate isomerase